VGGSCEGCEAIYESPVPLDKLPWIDTLPGFHESGPKMEISGTVYHPDGKTPAKDVVIYIYHTDQTGRYSTKGDEKGWGKRHGYIRGWMRTNSEGKYKFYTLRPAPYPIFPDAAHIHPVIKEPGKNEYYIDAYLFDDDPLLTDKMRKRLEQRGGDGILKLKEKNGIWYAERNIYLGKNIPGYPTASIKNIESGLSKAFNSAAFETFTLFIN
jgi:protocatechuate 3,4-dioxygenase beta subunit